MKTLKNSLIIFLTIFLIANSSFAGESEKVTFHGEIIIANKDLDQVTVLLYENNQIVQILKTDKNGVFDMDLQIGKFYTFEIIKEGYITKRVQVNTLHRNKIKEKIEDFSFYCELIPYRNWIDSSQLDFPITIIQLNEKKGKFQYASSYNKMMAKIEDSVVEQFSARFEF